MLSVCADDFYIWQRDWNDRVREAVRTERAAEILASGSHSVKEVAAMLGYSSPQYFATEFRKRRGFSPSCRHSD